MILTAPVSLCTNGTGPEPFSKLAISTIWTAIFIPKRSSLCLDQSDHGLAPSKRILILSDEGAVPLGQDRIPCKEADETQRRLGGVSGAWIELWPARLEHIQSPAFPLVVSRAIADEFAFD